MFKKILISIIVFYFLVLAQTSFILPNLTLILVGLWNLFERPKNYAGIYTASIAGFFLDVFSSRPFGFYILISLALTIFLKFFIRKYVKIPFLD